ncbi:MAG: DUF2007 domain-containing protein [Acidobacteria bacterium]|nr:DUF2007 domain-containing protein [Acidobacteriota bacterium]
MSEKQIRDEELVNVFASSNFDAESEAEVVHGLLTSSGIDAMIVRQNVTELPAGLVEVRVLESKAEEAKLLIESSRAGAAGGEE